jgi:hypothetical protein
MRRRALAIVSQTAGALTERQRDLVPNILVIAVFHLLALGVLRILRGWLIKTTQHG